jgi:peptidyl-prolyl cis-trans isomerase C
VFRSGFRILSLALLGALALNGCQPESDVLARVGSRTITRGDFLLVARALASRYPGPPDSAKAHLLRDMTDRELLVQGAMSEGMYRDTSFLDLRRRTEEQLLRQSYYDDLGATQVVVSAAEIEQLHRWRAEESQVQIVFTLTETAAWAALDQIRHGADFGDVADRFNPAGFTPPRGELGYLQPGMLQLPVDDLIRTAPVGKVVGPVEAVGQGWFLVLVRDRRKAEPKSLQQESEMLGSILRQRKQRQLLVRALDHLRGDYHVHLERGAAQSLIGYIMPPSLQGMEPPPLTLRESAQPLASYDGGTYTMGDAVQDLRNGSTQRPNFNIMPTVERWIEMRTLERAALLEGHRRQLDEQPDLQRALRERLNDYLLEAYITRQVLERTAVTEADARAEFDRLGMRPDRLESARFMVVVLRDSATAAQLAATAPQTQGLREAVTAAALGVAVRAVSVTYPTDDPMWTAFEPSFMSMAPGAYTPATPVSGLWAVAQLLSKNVVPQTYENLPAEMHVALENQARETKRAALLTALSDSLKRTIPVRVYEERLKRVEWPTPTGPTFNVSG